MVWFKNLILNQFLNQNSPICWSNQKNNNILNRWKWQQKEHFGWLAIPRMLVSMRIYQNILSFYLCVKICMQAVVRKWRIHCRICPSDSSKTINVVLFVCFLLISIRFTCPNVSIRNQILHLNDTRMLLHSPIISILMGIVASTGIFWLLKWVREQGKNWKEICLHINSANGHKNMRHTKCKCKEGTNKMSAHKNMTNERIETDNKQTK